MRHKLVFILAWAWIGIAQAAIIERPLADAAKEAQARELFHALKCVVCEGQSLADSDATLATQMRGEIREMLAAGNTPEDIRAYFRESYGDRIFMSPPVQGQTLILWCAPLLLLLLGGGVLWRMRKGEVA